MDSKMSVLLVACIAVLFLIFGLRSNSNRGKVQEPDVWPFYKRKLMTVPEQKLYWRLVRLFPEMIILAQVSASQVIRVRQGNNVPYWFNRICRTSYDFVICDKSSFPLVVIELDDASHLSAKRQADDLRKNKALAGAELKLIRLPLNRLPNNDAELVDLIMR